MFQFTIFSKTGEAIIGMVGRGMLLGPEMLPTEVKSKVS